MTTHKYVSIMRKDSGLEIAGQYKLKGVPSKDIHDQIMRIEEYVDLKNINPEKIKVEDAKNQRRFLYQSFLADVTVTLLSLDTADGHKVLVKTTTNITMMGESQGELCWDIQPLSELEVNLTCKGRVNISGIMASKIEGDLYRFFSELLQNLLSKFKGHSIRIFHDRKWVNFHD